MKLLLIGSSSTIGVSLIKNCPAWVDLVCLSRRTEGRECEIVDDYSISNVKRIVEKFEIEFIVNCVGVGSPDLCEKDKLTCKKLNYLFAKDLVDYSNKSGIKTLFFSTSMVYQGVKGKVYNEESSSLAVNYYGKIKNEADIYIRNNLSDYILLRPSAIFSEESGASRDNIFTYINKSIESGCDLSLVDDVKTNMLYVGDLTKFTYELIRMNAVGDYNLSGRDYISLYEFGCAISRVKGYKNKIHPTSTDKLGLLAERPRELFLDSSKASDLTGIEFGGIKEFCERLSKE